MWHDLRCFVQLEQEDQRLKKHYDRWMNIVPIIVTKPGIIIDVVGSYFYDKKS